MLTHFKDLTFEQRRALEGLILWAYNLRYSRVYKDKDLEAEALLTLKDYAPRLDSMGISWRIQNAAAGFGDTVDLRATYLSSFFNCETFEELAKVKTAHEWRPCYY